METKFALTILRNWGNAKYLRCQWQELSARAAPEHPFYSYDWFDCWYKAFCPPGAERIITLLDEKERLRAVFPGFLYKQSISGIPLACFSYAANGHSVRGGIIASLGDHEAIFHILEKAFTHLDPQPHLCVLPAVVEGSDSHKALKKCVIGKLKLREEHDYEAPGFAIPNGWSDYIKSKSPNTRGRLNQSLSRSHKVGEVKYSIFQPSQINSDLLNRFMRLDALTWQGTNKTGIFSTPENSIFYNCLLSRNNPGVPVFACLMSIGDRDAAYSIAVCSANKAYVLKYGYNPDFSYCRPGVITMARMGQYFSDVGIVEVDLGGGINEDKKRWETYRRRLANYWIINCDRLKGRLLDWLLRVNDKRKNLKGRTDKSNIEN